MLNAKRRLLCQRRGSQSLIVLMPQEEIEKRFSHNIVNHVELSKAIKYKQHLLALLICCSQQVFYIQCVYCTHDSEYIRGFQAGPVFC